MKKAFFAFLLVGVTFTGLSASTPAADPPSWRPSVRWRGFNLLGMFIWDAKKTHPTFPEEHFQIISDWGFNFVRLPLDYRFWTHGGDWNTIDGEALKPIDAAIALGRKYGVHVQVCFHRAPGYCISRAATEPEPLFESTNAVAVCARHWAFFARRYRGIPNENLSFNLMNEPAGVKAEKYAAVATALIDAIRREDPARFIISDGIDCGNTPVNALRDLPSVGQALRGYRPSSLTHYLASWAGSPNDPPRWPYAADDAIGLFAGTGKKDLRVPMTLADCPAGRLTLTFGKVSGAVVFRVSADGKTLRDITLKPAVGAPGWKNAKVHPEWGGLCQGDYTRTEEVEIPTSCKTLTLQVERGDWLNLTRITLTGADGRKAELPINPLYGRPHYFARRFVGWDKSTPFRAVETETHPHRYPDGGREFLYRSGLKDWDAFRAAGGFAMVGEFGAHNTVPHAIFLAWVEDNLRLWHERDLGWAIWNLTGAFGVLDSGRKDVSYESFRGHKLDRKLLDLLLKY